MDEEPKAQPITHEQLLRATVDDAVVLQEFAIASGRQIASGFHGQLSQAIWQLDAELRKEPNDSAALADAERQFRALYEQLAAVLTPVSARSIRSTRQVQGKSFFASTFFASAAAVFVLLAIVVLQGYWVVGKRHLELWQGFAPKHAAIELQIGTLRDSQDRAEERLKRNKAATPGASARGAAKPAAPLPAVERAKLDEQARLLNEELGRLAFELRPINRAQKNLQVLEDSVRRMIERLHAFGECVQGPFSALVFTRVCNKPGLANQSEAATEPTAADIQLLVYRFETVLEIIQAYVVPALLGLLGALVFILRDIGTRLKTYSYTPESTAHGSGRLALAFIAGVLGGWFMHSTDSVIKSVPPLVIPFLLGYAAEIFFGLLERLSKAMSSDPAPAGTPTR